MPSPGCRHLTVVAMSLTSQLYLYRGTSPGRHMPSVPLYRPTLHATKPGVGSAVFKFSSKQTDCARLLRSFSTHYLA
ncbi:hypothetical protein P3342_003296 [Pyrenophora teres f. teres]|nr:hypothetical protein P3342_003296 [Pyrenophora teres f. teres]